VGGRGAAAPLEDTLAPLRILFWAIILRERWLAGQKDAPIPMKTFF